MCCILARGYHVVGVSRVELDCNGCQQLECILEVNSCSLIMTCARSCCNAVVLLWFGLLICESFCQLTVVFFLSFVLCISFVLSFLSFGCSTCISSLSPAKVRLNAFSRYGSRTNPCSYHFRAQHPASKQRCSKTRQCERLRACPQRGMQPCFRDVGCAMK